MVRLSLDGQDLGTAASIQVVTNMAEQDWLRSDEPRIMLLWLRETKRITDQQLRLFAIACCDRVGRNVPKEWERTGDPYGMTDYAWANSWANATIELPRSETAAILRDVVPNPFRPVRLTPTEPANVFTALDVLADAARHPERGYISRAVLTPTVRQLADAIAAGHQHNDPAALAALSDAVQEAGLSETRRCPDPLCRWGDGTWADGDRCDTCHGTGTGTVPVPDEAARELLRHLTGWQRCHGCLGDAQYQPLFEGHDRRPCSVCHGVGWLPLATGHSRGCWAIELLRNTTTRTDR